MEGFLLKKEGYKLSYFEDFDLANERPVNLKGELDICGCTVDANPQANKKRKFAFNITFPDQKVFSVQASDERSYHAWIGAITACSQGRFGPETIDYGECYEALGFQESDNPSLKQLEKAYRLLARKIHPDKGGDIVEFKRVQDSLNKLKHKFEEEEKLQLYTDLEFDAVIRKGPPGVGFGMVVTEDVKKCVITIKSVLDTIDIVSMSPDVNQTIRKGDKIVMIGNDNISQWPMARVVQRLSDFRVPKGSTVRIRFNRRVRLDGSEDVPETIEEDTQNPDIIINLNTTAAAPQFDEAANEPDTPMRGSGRYEDYDIDETVRPESPTILSPVNSKSYFPPAAAATVSSQQPPAKAHTNPIRPNADRTRRSFSYISDPVIRCNVLTEVEELEAEIEAKARSSSSSSHVTAAGHGDVSLHKEIDAFKRQLAESALREKYLEMQIQQAMFQYEANSDYVMQSMKHMIRVSSAIMAGKVPETNIDISKYLEGANEASESVKTARHTAVAAVAAIDPSQVVLQKWAISGMPVLEKLTRLEQRLAKFES